jgi:hypothetical protein
LELDVPVIAESNRWVFIPLFIPPGVERPDIITSVAAQVAAIMDAIRAHVLSALLTMPEAQA